MANIFEPIATTPFSETEESIIIQNAVNKSVQINDLFYDLFSAFTFNRATGDLTVTGSINCNNLQYKKKDFGTSRPSGATIGQSFFDTSLGISGKPIWWDGAQWVDATGAAT